MHQTTFISNDESLEESYRGIAHFLKRPNGRNPMSAQGSGCSKMQTVTPETPSVKNQKGSPSAGVIFLSSFVRGSFIFSYQYQIEKGGDRHDGA